MVKLPWFHQAHCAEYSNVLDQGEGSRHIFPNCMFTIGAVS